MTLLECLEKIVLDEIEGFNVKTDHSNTNKLIRILKENVNEKYEYDLFEYIARLNYFNFFSELYDTIYFADAQFVIGGYLFHQFDQKETIKYIDITKKAININRTKYVPVKKETKKSASKELSEPPLTPTTTIPTPTIPTTTKQVPTRPVRTKTKRPRRKLNINISIFRIFDKLLFGVMFFIYMKVVLDSVGLKLAGIPILGLFLILAHSARAISYMKDRKSLLILPTLSFIVGIFITSAVTMIITDNIITFGLRISVHIIYVLVLLGLDRLRDSFANIKLISILHLISPIFIIYIVTVILVGYSEKPISLLVVTISLYILSLIAPEEYFFYNDDLKYVLKVVLFGLLLIIGAIVFLFKTLPIVAIILVLGIVIGGGFLIYNELNY